MAPRKKPKVVTKLVRFIFEVTVDVELNGDEDPEDAAIDAATEHLVDVDILRDWNEVEVEDVEEVLKR